MEPGLGSYFHLFSFHGYKVGQDLALFSENKKMRLSWSSWAPPPSLGFHVMSHAIVLESMGLPLVGHPVMHAYSAK